MKKLSIIFLSLLFLVSTVGLTINTHFCGRLHTSMIVLFSEKSCDCKNQKMPIGCCKNETKIVKIADDYSPSQSVNIVPSYSCLATPLFANNLFVFSASCNTFSFYLNIRPPLLHTAVSLPVLYRSILI